jgi:hypothetical protein
MLGVVTHACGPAYSEGEGGRISISDWSRQKWKTQPEKQTESKCGGGTAPVISPYSNTSVKTRECQGHKRQRLKSYKSKTTKQTGKPGTTGSRL